MLILRIDVGSSNLVLRPTFLHLLCGLMVDSGASLRRMSGSDLAGEEQETTRRQQDPAFVRIAVGMRQKKQQYMSVIWTCLCKFNC